MSAESSLPTLALTGGRKRQLTISTNSRRLPAWGLGLGVGSGASSAERKVCPRSLASRYCSSYSSCNRLWRLSCASRSSSSTLGGLPEERNTFTGCRHDDLEWAVAVAFSRPELAAAPRLQKRVTDSGLSILAVWMTKTPHPANRHAREKCVVGPHCGQGAEGFHTVPSPVPRLLTVGPRDSSRTPFPCTPAGFSLAPSVTCSAACGVGPWAPQPRESKAGFDK